MLKQRSDEQFGDNDEGEHAVERTRLAAAWLQFARRLANHPLIRDRVPPRYQPTLFFETFYSVGSGSFLAFMLLTPVALKTVVPGTPFHLALFGALMGGSSLLSPLVSYMGRRIPMRSLVVIPNLLVAVLLLATSIPSGGATLFALVMGMAFVIRVFPRVAEMNMYRVNYPVTHRGSAVGWLRAVAAIAGLAITLFGYIWFARFAATYWVVFCLVGTLLAVAAYSYSRIPVSRRNVFARPGEQGPWSAFVEGVKLFWQDKRFVLYQIGFAIPGFANHMAMMFVVQVLSEDVLAKQASTGSLPPFIREVLMDSWHLSQQQAITVVVGFAFAVLPMLVTIASSPFWGRFVDRTTPMYARSIFNAVQCAAFVCHGYGGLTMKVWPFILGGVLQALSSGGGTINWLTGSLYFAPRDRVSLYNAVHVCLTGIRGLIAPAIGLWLYSPDGMNLGPSMFLVAAGLSLVGSFYMRARAAADRGPRELLEVH